MTPAQSLYHQIASELPDATESKMFGALCIKAPNGKAAAMFFKEEMVFKTDKTTEAELLSLDGAHVFTPSEGKSMNGWIQVPYHYHDRWKEFAESSMKIAAAIKVKG